MEKLNFLFSYFHVDNGRKHNGHLSCSESEINQYFDIQLGRRRSLSSGRHGPVSSLMTSRRCLQVLLETGGCVCFSSCLYYSRAEMWAQILSNKDPASHVCVCMCVCVYLSRGVEEHGGAMFLHSSCTCVQVHETK